MKIYLLASFSLFLAAAATVSAREFTDLQGRKLEAEILGAASGQVTLKRTDGRIFTVAATMFTAEDQKFITEWADNNTKYNFEVTYTKKKLNESKTKRGPVTYEDETWIYKINIRNRQPTTVGDLRVDYWCFRREDGGKGKGAARIETSGTTKVPSVAGSGTVTVDTAEIVLHKQELAGGYYFTNGDDAIQSDGMGGFALRIFDRKGREVYKWATKDDLFAAAVGTPQTRGSNSQSSASSK